MAKAFALRSSSSGPQFDGVAGDVLTMEYDGKCRFVAPGAAGGIVPLTLEFWVDQGRVGSTQDGSIANPFLTIQNGIDAIEASGAGAGSLQVAQGDYSGEALICGLPISLVASTKPISVASLGLEAAPVSSMRLVNVNVMGDIWIAGDEDQPLTVEGGGLRGDVTIVAGHLTAINAELGEVICSDALNDIVLRGCRVLSIAGSDTLQTWDTTIVGDCASESAVLRVSTVGGLLAVVTNATLEQSNVHNAEVGGTLTADAFSLRALRNGELSTAAATFVSDNIRNTAVLTIPPLANGFADVTVSGVAAFAKEGDTVCYAMADSSTLPRLPDIAIVGAWVKPNGDLVFRVFGITTGGGQLVDFNLNQNSP